MSQQNIFERLKSSATVKLISIGIICLILLIPAQLIRDTTHERSRLKSQIEQDVATSYGKDQMFYGPILNIPYKKVEVFDDKEIEILGMLHMLPKNIRIENNTNTDVRKRSIYEIIVYNNRLKGNGVFEIKDLSYLIDEGYSFTLDKAYVSLGLTDNKRIKGDIKFNIDERQFEFEPSYYPKEIVPNGLATEVFDIQWGDVFNFAFEMQYQGSKALFFMPQSESCRISINSNWPSPSFVGGELPYEYSITQSGFEATWQTNQFSHNLPKYWFDKDYKLSTSNHFGVSLIEPVDGYGKNLRTSKYAFLIIILTFCVFFFYEILYKINVHPIQYLMVGMALVTFFLLLIAITEHLGFGFAYGVAAFATILLIVVYAYYVFQKANVIKVLLPVLSLLFTYIYVILQLENYALLFGSIGFFIILTLVMMLSRNVNWYKLKKA